MCGLTACHFGFGLNSEEIMVLAPALKLPIAILNLTWQMYDETTTITVTRAFRGNLFSTCELGPDFQFVFSTETAVDTRCVLNETQPNRF